MPITQTIPLMEMKTSFLNFCSNPILIIPIIFWVIQSTGGFIRNKLDVEKEHKNYTLEFFKSIGFNLCSIVLSVDFTYLSQYSETISQDYPFFWLLFLFHLLAWVASFLDVTSYGYFSSKIEASEETSKILLWKITKFVIFLIFLIIGIACVYSLYKMFNIK